ncbi:hypothetical protein HK103_003384 [Boothiomyces macroporosus]|uniref:Uncharacterized protein n=1 Tax=Boothiomyces macroporosus TaxID=261099 RepID=A0AAD5U9R3_9FUNG|nr:hypothetical protein HK103_003384 [Boothiomyces macroporosus]
MVQQRKLIVFCGPTLTGKSETAWELAGSDAYSKNLSKYWPGYHSQRSVIIDQYRGKYLDLQLLSDWLDGQDVEVPKKGIIRARTFRGRQPAKLVAEVIYITTLLHPRDWKLRKNREILQKLEVVEFPRE